MSITYRKRQNAFVKAEDEWRIDDDALVHTSADGTVRRLYWRDVARVRLSFAPTRLKTHRYVFVADGKVGGSISFDNLHFAGLADFEDRSSTYTPFVHAALERIRSLAPEARLHIGSGMLSYVVNLLFVGIAFLGLVAVLFVLPNPVNYLSGSSWVKLGIVILLMPLLVRWIRKARPRGASLDAIPADALPPGG